MKEVRASNDVPPVIREMLEEAMQALGEGLGAP